MDDQNVLADIDRRALAGRARAYEHRCERWLEHWKGPHSADAEDPLTAVRRFAPLIALEIHDRNAELTLLAIERSRIAWLALVRYKAIRPHLAEPFVSDLVWLKHEIERVFPQARAAGPPSPEGSQGVVPTM
jgi:hypothetical protein